MSAVIARGHRFTDAGTGVTLDAWFPVEGVEPFRFSLVEEVGLAVGTLVEVEIESLDEPPADAADVYLRLHLLSRCQVRPNEVNLEGLFGLLTTVAWTSAGPVLPARLDELRSLAAQHKHVLEVPSIDKFPRMTDYVSPHEVRIADADRVRLGAHLAPGTTVMHEGFVNFNAGIGISLGERCIVEAGLYVTAGTKVTTEDGVVVQARALSGKSDLMFRRHSQTGAVEAVSSAQSNWGGLNTDLHAN